MGFIDDNARLDIECPHCKTKFAKTIRELKGTGVKCPRCGVRFETSQFKKGMDDVDRSVRDLQSKLKNMKFRI